MKKRITLIVSGLILIIVFIFYGGIGANVTHEVLTEKEVPEDILKQLEAKVSDIAGTNFSLVHDEKYTYVLYEADHGPNEYISTNLTVRKKKFRNYVFTAKVSYATDDGDVSYKKIIKTGKISNENIILKEDIKR